MTWNSGWFAISKSRRACRRNISEWDWRNSWEHEYEWLHDPLDLIEKVGLATGTFMAALWGETHFSCIFTHYPRSEKYAVGMGAVDPVYRGTGVWKKMGRNILCCDRIKRCPDGDRMGCDNTQIFPDPGWRSRIQANGCFIGGEFFGGSDNRYLQAECHLLRQTLQRWKEALQKLDNMQLTENSEKLAKIVGN